MAKEYLLVDGKLVKADTKLVQVPDVENLNDLADENGAYATQSEEVANEIEELIVKNGVIDGSPKGVYASLSALQTAYPSGASGVYLTSDNGHWYYWNGTAWTDGGVYQTSEDIEQIKKDLVDLDDEEVQGYILLKADDFELGKWNGTTGEKSSSDDRMIRTKKAYKVRKGTIIKTSSVKGLYWRWMVFKNGERVASNKNSDTYADLIVDKTITLDTDGVLVINIRNGDTYNNSTNITPDDFNGTIAFNRLYSTLIPHENKKKIDSLKYDAYKELKDIFDWTVGWYDLSTSGYIYPYYKERIAMKKAVCFDFDVRVEVAEGMQVAIYEFSSEELSNSKSQYWYTSDFTIPSGKYFGLSVKTSSQTENIIDVYDNECYNNIKIRPVEKKSLFKNILPFNEYEYEKKDLSVFELKGFDYNVRVKLYPVFLRKGSIICNYNKDIRPLAFYANGYIDEQRAINNFNTDGYPSSFDISIGETADGVLTVQEDGYYIIIYKINTTNKIYPDDCKNTIAYNYLLQNKIEGGSNIVKLNQDVENTLIASKKKYNNDTTSITTLLHFSDLHEQQSVLKRIVEFKQHYSEYIEDVICTGDIIAESLAESPTMDFWNKVSGASSILTCIGNHDAVKERPYNWDDLETMSILSAKYIEPYSNNWGAITTTGKTYYYKDYVNSKLRLIVLDTTRTGSELTEQNTWLSSILNEAKTNGYGVVIAQHFPPKNAVRIDSTFTNKYKSIYFDNHNGMDASYQATVQTFIDNGGNFICYLCGHTHTDFVLYNNDYPEQIFIVVDTANNGINANYSDTNRVVGTKSEDLFNLVSIDTNKKIVKIMRVGADKDLYLKSKKVLTIDCNIQQVITNY